jgi:hypothetical protein
MLHLHRVCVVAAMPRLKKKVPAGTLCLICQKGAILSDFAQIITDFGNVEEVMAELDALVQQHRYQLVIERFEFRISIHVKNLDPGPKLGRQKMQGSLHVVTQMAVGA